MTWARNLFPTMSLRRVVVATMLGGSAISGAVILSVVDNVATSTLRGQAVAGMQQTANEAAARLDLELYERFHIVRALVRPIENTGRDEAAIRPMIEQLHESFPDYSWVAFVDTDGTVGVANGGLLEGRSVAERPWFAPSLQREYVGDVHDAVLLAQLLGPDSRGQAPRFIDFGFPVRSPDGGLLGVLAAHLNWTWTENLLEAFRRKDLQDQGYDLWIVNMANTVVHGPAAMRGKPLPDIGATGELMVEGRPRLAVFADAKGYKDVPSLGWKIVVLAEPGIVFGLADRLRMLILWWGIPTLALFALGGLFLARWICRPIELLDKAALQGGEIPMCSRFHETASLSRSVASALSQLQAAQQATEEEVRLRTAELNDILRVVDTHAIVSMADRAGRIIHCNDLFCAVSGYSRDELVGQNHRIVRSGHHDTAFYEDMWKTISAGRTWQGVICNRAKDGSEYWVRSTISSIIHDGHPAYISIRTDITDIVRDREKLTIISRDLNTFRQIIDSTTEAVSVMDRDGNYIYCNPAREKLLGLSLGEIKGKNIREAIPQSSHSILGKVFEAIEMRQPWRGMLPLRKANGETIISASNIGVVLGENDAPAFIFNVFHDYTAELSRTKQLENARHAAEAANRAKSEFLSGMSHELRTPLNAILGFAQLLLTSRKASLTEQQREQIGHILSGGEHLLELINQVLDLAKIEAGKLSLSIENLALPEVLDECVRMIAPVMDRYNVTLLPCHCVAGHRIHADRVRAKQVIFNLLSNAAKYNRPNGTVALSCDLTDGGMIRLSVADTGRGIPQARMVELFQPFSRLGAETTEIEGTGVGLALTKNLIESMGGHIGAESEEGVGSRFWLDFVAAIEPQNEEVSNAKTFAVEPSAEIAQVTARILYVEDNPANIKLMEGVIGQMDGAVLVTAQTAEAGLALVSEIKPDIIIMDINLPGMSGIEAVRHLKSDPATASIPVLALSADATARTIGEGMAAGFHAYLSKPVNLADLVRHISAALDSRHV